MPRAVKRRLITVAATASLLMFIATVALWVRSYFTADEFMDSHSSRLDMVWTVRGTVFIQRTHLSSEPVAPLGTYLTTVVLITPPRWRVGLPIWFLAIVFSLLPLRWGIRARRTCSPGLCLGCGYDLRATPARCPECGAVPAAPEAR
jgi:hypothetical protein